MPNVRLFIGNVAPTLDERTLTVGLLSLGVPVVNPKILRDRATGVSRGFAFVEVQSDPEWAITTIRGKKLVGYTLRAEIAEGGKLRPGGKRALRQAAPTGDPRQFPRKFPPQRRPGNGPYRHSENTPFKGGGRRG